MTDYLYCRETEWIFSTTKGRSQLAESAGFERLVVVSLDRNHTYKDLAAIQSELSEKVMELSPPGFKQGKKVNIRIKTLIAYNTQPV